ncbi:alpha/beta hydrolase [Corynebacterium crudilactis]|uniref:Hydrolase n=1 Tax=Corynebacterium crudilactis TaxID=1652495 RepID=A0A172QXD0_9CORY|nr:alpha/beta hydrolase [Corynebacterium crudilactis]ANE05301.1 hydrolase [Corynebacterium crudilactis]
MLAVLAATTALSPFLISTPLAAAQENITWEECPPQVDIASAQCGRIDVPMHYSDPSLGDISVGFVKVPAQGQKRGTVFGNAGGPGGDAYSFFGNQAMNWPAAMYQEFDLVAVQPRGMVGSTPVDCNNIAPGYDPLSMLTREGAFVKDSCEIGTPGYTSSLTTDNTANDWERVRQALGEDKISIFGLSYGTYLGSVYASRYPQHTDKVVLDSAMSPNLAWNGIMASQEQGYKNSLNDFFNWVAANNDTYHLGATPLAVYQNWSNKIVAETGTNPTVAPPPAQVGDIPPAFAWAGQTGADVITATNPASVQIQGLASQLLNPGSNQSMSPLLNASRALIPQPTTWPMLADAIAGHTPIPDVSETGDDPYVIESMNASVNMQRLVMCNENTVAPDPVAIARMAWTGFVTGDVFDVYSVKFSSGQACSGINPSSGQQPTDGSQLAVRPLLLQGTSDPQTPYWTHGDLARSMNAHVVTVNGPGHGQAYGGNNQAVNNIVVDYLRTGHATATSVEGYTPTPITAG